MRCSSTTENNRTDIRERYDPNKKKIRQKKRFVGRPHITISLYFSSQLFAFVTLTDYFQID